MTYDGGGQRHLCTLLLGRDRVNILKKILDACGYHPDDFHVVSRLPHTCVMECESDIYTGFDFERLRRLCEDYDIGTDVRQV